MENEWKNKMKQLNEMLIIQGQTGNWDTSSYNCGLYNGLELAQAILENREPIYKRLEDIGVGPEC